MRRRWLISLIIVPIVLAGGWDGPVPAAGKTEKTAIARDIQVIEAQQPKAIRGDKDAIDRLVSLAARPYAATAEGGARINEIYLDLLVRRPRDFLAAVAWAEWRTRDKIVAALLAPVSDKYSRAQLLTAVKTAQTRGVRESFMEELIAFYGTAR